MSRQDDDLAYGKYYESERGAASGDANRGLVGDTFKKLRDTYKTHSSQNQPGYQGVSLPNILFRLSLIHLLQQGYQNHGQPAYGYNPPSHGTGPQQYQQPPYQAQPPKDDRLSGFLGKIQGAVTDLGTGVAQTIGTTIDPQAYAQYGPSRPSTENRFGSFAPSREHNDAKWYVDGCSYFWAVSRALENARESIWILDCKF